LAPIEDDAPSAGGAKLHIVLVEDDPQISAMLGDFLRMRGVAVSALRDGRGLARVLGAAPVDAVILDVMLPGQSGLEILRRLRQTSTVPVILLTALGEEADRVTGLEVGADDYVVKPFSPRELLARIRSVLRRDAMGAAGRSTGGSLGFDGWRLDLRARTLHAPDGALVRLTAGEFGLLSVLAAHPGQVLSREHLHDASSGRDLGPFDRSVDVLVGRLRRKLEERPEEPSLIKTVRNGGYIFTPTVSAIP
jgi:two-component system OmpR family response regulator